MRWPQSPEDILAVRAQLNRMLNHPLFSQSRRYPRLLRHIVEVSLAGDFDSLKERSLGIDLFERVPDYDTNADAIVRVTAGELRKRIAQYYHEKERGTEPRINLPVGGYVAAFSPAPMQETRELPPPSKEVAGTNGVPIVRESLEVVPAAPIRSSDPSHPGHPGHPGWPGWNRLAIFSVSLALLLALIGLWRVGPGRHDEMQEFWRPFLSDGVTPLLCVGQLPLSTEPQGPQDSLGRTLLSQKPVSISDAVVVSQYVTYLGMNKIRPRIQVSSATTYADLRHNPVLLIGGLDNNWTLRLLDRLRFRMRSEPNSGVVELYDSADPASIWKMDFAAKSDHVSDDFAIVSRFYSSETEGTVIVAAGLGESGTAAAADFLLHSPYLQEIDKAGSPRWKKQNVELVLKTHVIDGNQGPPVIVARYFW